MSSTLTKKTLEWTTVHFARISTKSNHGFDVIQASYTLVSGSPNSTPVGWRDTQHVLKGLTDQGTPSELPSQCL